MITWYKNLSLRWRLSLLITSVAIYTAMTIALAVYSLWTDQIRTQVSERLQQNTELAAYSIKQGFIYEHNNLNAWAQLDVMIDLITDDLDKRIINTLNLLKLNYHLPGDLILVNNQNKVIASTNAELKYVDDFEGEMLLTGDLIHNGKIISKVPVYLSILPDTVSGYLILTHPWQDVIKQLATPLQEFLIVHQNKIYHFNRSTLLHSSAKDEIDLDALYWLMDAEEKIHSKRVNLLHLSQSSVDIYGMVNKDTAFKPIQSTLFLIALVTLLLLVPIAFISFYSSKRFLKPIIDLQQTAEEIADSGDLSLRINVNSKDEIGRLASILNKMTHNLKEAFEKNKKSNDELQTLTETLEIRVQERTKELSQTLEKLKSAQSQLVQSEKMSSLGQLVAGIAHELNNPISSVYVNTPILKQYIDDLIEIIDYIGQADCNKEKLLAQLAEIDYEFIKSDIFELLNAQEDAAKRIRDIVLSLRTFSRLDEAEIKAIDLNQGIDNTINILRHEIKHRIEIHKDYQLQKPVECFPGEINQVILNILANAAQAIGGEGNIWISTCLTDDNMAKITIRDDGAGLPQSIIDKIFDPFFTTKPVGVGTGLGLSISYGIIEKHQGRIKAENVSPHGAQFTIEIPIKQSKKS